jgi:hypothetical protein
LKYDFKIDKPSIKKNSVFLFAPRQVGKSTLIRHLLYVEEHIKVDLIIEAEDALWAIEIKSYPTFKSGNLTGLKSFMEDHPKAKPLCLPAVGKSAGFRLVEPADRREADPN